MENHLGLVKEKLYRLMQVGISYFCLVEGFHVMLYQANFASHYTCDCHVGFLFTQHGIGKYNKMLLLISYHNTTLQLSDKNISTHTHTLGCNIKSFSEVNRKFNHFCCFSLYTVTYKRETKRHGRIMRVVQTFFTAFIL